MVSSSFPSRGHHFNRAQSSPQHLHGSRGEYLGSQSHSFAAEGVVASEELCSSSAFHVGVSESSLSTSDYQPCSVGCRGTELDNFLQVIHPSERLKMIEADLQMTLEPEMSQCEVAETEALPIVSGPLSNYKLNSIPFKKSTQNECTNRRGREMSTEETMRVAAAHFIQISARTGYNPSILSQPRGLSLSSGEMKSVDLMTLLLAAAKKVDEQEHGSARGLLAQCHELSSHTGNTVQRVVYYFSNALEERMAREHRRLLSKRPRETEKPKEDVVKTMLTAQSIQLVLYEKVPFPKLLQSTSMQTMIEYVASAKRIHMIDFSIRYGVHWIDLVQALVDRRACPVEYLKITAVGTPEEGLIASGKRLRAFAESVSLSLNFRTVVVADMKDLKEDMFKVENGETVGIYSLMHMSTGIARPDSLENLMEVLQKLKPSVMVVTETEAKHNSPSFTNRFTEALFHFGAWFDCLDNVMSRSDMDRITVEGSILFQGMKGIIATEGSERLTRHVGLNKWRSFFRQFGVVEAGLSEHSSYLAGLISKKLLQGNSCTFEMNGKSLMVGWKGTPLFFISAWNFKQGEEIEEPSPSSSPKDVN